MIKPEIWPVQHQKWDGYRAFHVAAGSCGFHATESYHRTPLVLFDTGELICTTMRPDPTDRHRFNSVNVELSISEDMTGWWTPCGLEIASGKSWLEDAGSQWFLIDLDMDEAVRIDSSRSHNASRGDPPVPPRPGVPARFRDVPAYIPGPGCHPVGSGAIVVRPTHAAYYERHPHLKEKHAEIRTQATSIATMCEERYTTQQPLPFERLLAVTCATQLNADERARIKQYGVARPRLLHHRLHGQCPKEHRR